MSEVLELLQEVYGLNESDFYKYDALDAWQGEGEEVEAINLVDGAHGHFAWTVLAERHADLLEVLGIGPEDIETLREGLDDGGAPTDAGVYWDTVNEVGMNAHKDGYLLYQTSDGDILLIKEIGI